MKNVKKHFWHYLIYFFIFVGGLLLVMQTRNNTRLQAFSLIFTGILYFAWAMVHHRVHHQLTKKIAIEYLLIVILGIVLLLFLFGV